MPNQNVNHVELADGTTIMDIRDTTATPGDVAAGATFYDRSGAQQTGTLGPFTGATGATGGSDGLVPAPAAGDQAKVLTGGGSWQVVPGARLIETSGTVTNTSGSYTGTFNNSDVTADQQAIQIELGTPSVFRSTISVTCDNGTVTVSCSDVVGESTIKIYSIKSATDAQAITSAEFDILDAGKQDKTDNNLNTTAKTIVGAINEHETDIIAINSNIENQTELYLNSLDAVKTALLNRSNVLGDGESCTVIFFTNYSATDPLPGNTLFQGVMTKRVNGNTTISLTAVSTGAAYSISFDSVNWHFTCPYDKIKIQEVASETTVMNLFNAMENNSEKTFYGNTASLFTDISTTLGDYAYYVFIHIQKKSYGTVCVYAMSNGAAWRRFDFGIFGTLIPCS